MISIKTMCAALTLILLLSSGVVSHADGNTSDTTYTFNNSYGSGNSEYRYKSNYTKVYVHPTSGPTIKYTVYGAYDTFGDGRDSFSDTVYFGTGTYASITNYVKENNRNYAQLHFTRMVNTMNENTVGVWSPDSTQNYTVYGN